MANSTFDFNITTRKSELVFMFKVADNSASSNYFYVADSIFWSEVLKHNAKLSFKCLSL